MPPHLLSLLALMLMLTVVHAAAQTPTLDITGADSRLADNIRAYVDIADESCQGGSWRLRAIARKLDDNITQAGRALGYYHMTVDKSFAQEENCWRLQLAVEPGEPTRLSEISLALLEEGESDGELQRVLQGHGLNRGDVLHHGRFDSFKSRLLSAASARGYFDADYATSEVLVSLEEKLARVNMRLDTGPRYRLGAIEVTHDILDAAFIDRYLTDFQTGQHYQAADLERLRREFRSGGYFEAVRVVPDLQERTDGQVPVVIDLTGGPRHSYSAGAGYATDIGPRVRLGYENRYINQRGHTLSAYTNIAENVTTYQLTYGIPMRRPAYDQLRLFTGFDQEKLNDWQSDRLATGVQYSTWHKGNWLSTYGLNVEREDYRFGEAPSRRAEMVIPSWSASLTRGPESNYPLSGWSLLVRFKGASEDLGSSTDFVQAFGRLKYIQKLGAGRLLLRAEGGVTEVDDFTALPVSLRFFAGGDASVRGYGYKTLGPLNEDALVVGGSRLLTTSVEYDYRVYGDWALAIFLDQGNAFHDGDYERYRGVGAGVRWVSPVGPVRVDIAHALDGERGWRLHLSVGPDL